MKPYRKIALALFEPDVPRRLFSGVLRYARSRGNWEFAINQGMPVTPRRSMAHLKADGIIAACTDRHDAMLLRRTGVPVVSVTCRFLPHAFPTVTSDNRAIGRMAAEHLVSNGFKHFAFFGSSTLAYDQERAQGFSEVLKRRGLACIPCLTRHLPRRKGPLASRLHDPEHLAKLLHPLPKPIGIMAGHDMVGCRVLIACKILGLSVPESVGIVGCDNDEMWCEMATPGLTSIDRREEQIGFAAAELLDCLIEGETVPSGDIRIPPDRLILRPSSDLFAVPDAEVAAAMRFIRNRASENISVGDVLAQVPISRRVLEVRFRKVVGRTIHSEIRRSHIRLAKDLLDGTNLSITEVARRTGFNHDSRFRVAFKKETGMCPRVFRKHRRDSPTRTVR
jgi:LacI family transcriptional regulator